MGFAEVASERNRFRYRVGSSDNGSGNLVDLVCAPDATHGSPGAGVVHHVACRMPDDAQQAMWHRKIIQASRNASPVMDRSYFHSVYYHEPGGVLFEIATNNPRFTADEPAGN